MRESLSILLEVNDRSAAAQALDGLANTFERDEPERAARIWGGVESLRRLIGFPRPVTSQQSHDRHVACARETLGDELAFERAWNEGMSKTLPEVARYALEVSDRAWAAQQTLLRQRRDDLPPVSRGFPGRNEERLAEMLAFNDVRQPPLLRVDDFRLMDSVGNDGSTSAPPKQRQCLEMSEAAPRFASRVRAGVRRFAGLCGRPMFREALRDCVPMSIGIAAWGLVAGVAMAKSGMGALLAILMAVLVYAGSAQIAVIPLIAAGAPMWVVWGTAACVCLRFLVYSYYYRPYFLHLPRRRRLLMSYFMGDTSFAMFIRRFPQPDATGGQDAYFAGVALVTYLSWQVSIITGIVGGQVVPQSWGLGFAGTMALLALCCTQMRTPSACVAALVACGAAVASYGLPLHLNIVVAIAAAIATGALAQRLHSPKTDRGAS